MRQRSFESVVRRKVLLALAPLSANAARLATVSALRGGGHAAVGTALSLGAAWIAFVYRDEIFHLSDRARDHVIGLHSERVVQERLRQLEDRCFVQHDVGLPWGGNIDHVVCGPTGAFAIETKTNRYLPRDLGVPRGRAKWLSTKLGDHWVTPVICLVNRDQLPYERDRVWVMGVTELVPWLEGRRDRPIEPNVAFRVLGE
jgi:hypothetical protein